MKDVFLIFPKTGHHVFLGLVLSEYSDQLFSIQLDAFIWLLQLIVIEANRYTNTFFFFELIRE